MLHPDEVLTRERLLDAVWGWSYPAATRAVDTRIAELRRLLKDDADTPRYIETLIGQGYRFLGRWRAAGDKPPGPGSRGPSPGGRTGAGRRPPTGLAPNPILYLRGDTGTLLLAAGGAVAAAGAVILALQARSRRRWTRPSRGRAASRPNPTAALSGAWTTRSRTRSPPSAPRWPTWATPATMPRWPACAPRWTGWPGSAAICARSPRWRLSRWRRSRWTWPGS